MTLLVPAAGGKPREVATAVNQALKGKINAVGTVTLTASATSTTVKNQFVSKSSVILFAPQTANALAMNVIGDAPYVKPADITDADSFKITHGSEAHADLQFAYVILG